MISKDWLLSLITFVGAPPLLLGLRYISRRLRLATREAVEANSRVLGAMQETIQGISIVKAFTMEDELGRKVEGIIKGAENRANRIARLSERTAPLTETFAGLAISGVLAYAAFRTIYGNVPPGALFAFVAALLMQAFINEKAAEGYALLQAVLRNTYHWVLFFSAVSETQMSSKREQRRR